jgi:hypothetical protein
MPLLVTPLGNPQYPLYRRLGGPQSQSGHDGENNRLPLPGIELQLLAVQSVAWFLYRLI